MRRVAAVALGVLAAFVLAAPARAQSLAGERIVRYDVEIVIENDGALRISETIDYDFGTMPRHGIIREIPTTFRYDDTYDREYPVTVESVTATGDASADYVIEHPGGGVTAIRIGDPDRTITGRHTYTIRYRVEAALNGFRDHVELYWNAIGDEWDVPIDIATTVVRAPARILQVACYTGYEGSSLPCARASSGPVGARFAQRDLQPFQGMTVVVSLPKGAVPAPEPRLRERWSPARAFALTPTTGAASGGLLVLAIGGFGYLLWRTGRDRRWRGGQVDQVMGNPTGESQSVPLFEGDASAPVEFAPPADLRPGQIGTLLDERANTLDVTATIVDLAVRGYLLIQEIPKEGLFGKPDWTLIRLEQPEDELLPYERKLLNGLFEDGTEVTLSSLRNTFAERLKGVEESLYVDGVTQGWFTARPDKVRTSVEPARVATAAGGDRSHVRARAVDPLGDRRDPRDRGWLAARLVRPVHAGAHAEGDRHAAASAWLPDRDRDRRDPHVPMGRGGERLPAVPAVRDRLRRAPRSGRRRSRGWRVSKTPPGTCLPGRSSTRTSRTRWTGSRSRAGGCSPRRRRPPDRAGSAAAASPGAAAVVVAADRGDTGLSRPTSPRAAP